MDSEETFVEVSVTAPTEPPRVVAMETLTFPFAPHTPFTQIGEFVGAQISKLGVQGSVVVTIVKGRIS